MNATTVKYAVVESNLVHMIGTMSECAQYVKQCCTVKAIIRRATTDEIAYEDSREQYALHCDDFDNNDFFAI